MKKPAILIAEGDASLRQQLKGCLLAHGFDVIEASDGHDALRSFERGCPALAIVGSSRDSASDGIQVAERIRRLDQKIPLIIVAKQSSEERVIAALRLQVNDYFKVPFSHAELIASVDRNLSSHRPDSPDLSQEDSMVGESPPMREIKAELARIASADSTVLITGETGTGKELVAEVIHKNSPRCQKPFVCINCAAVPESLLESELFGYERGAFTGAVGTRRGKFEAADRGTVFLDEIGDMSPYAQAKILRAIEKKEVDRLGGRGGILVDVRVIAATHRDPERLVAEGKFREDLYYRLNVARVHLPPLRERVEDIPRLIQHGIRELNRRYARDVEGFSASALQLLLHYDWPGNIRELKNLLEAAFINLPSRRISTMALPKAFRRRLEETEGLPQNERNRLLSALFAANWNKSRAAKKLHWSRMTLYRKMAKYDIRATGRA